MAVHRVLGGGIELQGADPGENVRTGKDDLPRNRQDGACVPPGALMYSASGSGMLPSCSWIIGCGSR